MLKKERFTVNNSVSYPLKLYRSSYMSGMCSKMLSLCVLCFMFVTLESFKYSLKAKEGLGLHYIKVMVDFLS